MTDHPTYKIERISDFLAVPPERLMACWIEFGKWLVLANEIKDAGDPYMFVWIDDGDTKLAVSLRDHAGEEIERIEMGESP